MSSSIIDSHIKSLCPRALDTCKARGASYADVRFVERRIQRVHLKDGKSDLVERESRGFGIRVIVDGAWGFASSSTVEAREVDKVAALAVSIARASAMLGKEKAYIGEPLKVSGSYRTPVVIDPFSMSLEKKFELVSRACEEMQKVKGVTTVMAALEARRENKILATSEGSNIEQELVRASCQINAQAAGQEEVQDRSYPDSLGCAANEGWEFVERQDLTASAPRIAEEAVALLKAKPCPSGITTVILDGGQLALQLHESCGHAIELDRVLGAEASYAGTSFLTTEKLGRFRYGSNLINITADSTLHGGLGSFGYDDEGVPAQRVEIVRNGLFTGYLTSRETAPHISQRSNGCMRAESWEHLPLIRMTNVNLEPGEWKLQDLIEDTADGIFMKTNRSWSIDDRRLNFQFGTEIAWEIKKGKLGAMLKNATYSGMTPEFWSSCDAICSSDYWKLWGVANCGKGQPVQTMGVAHGTAPARFRNVRVGLVKT